MVAKGPPVSYLSRESFIVSSLETSVNILLAFNFLIIASFNSIAGVALGILSWKEFHRGWLCKLKPLKKKPSTL